MIMEAQDTKLQRLASNMKLCVNCGNGYAFMTCPNCGKNIEVVEEDKE